MSAFGVVSVRWRDSVAVKAASSVSAAVRRVRSATDSITTSESRGDNPLNR